MKKKRLVKQLSIAICSSSSSQVPCYGSVGKSYYEAHAHTPERLHAKYTHTHTHTDKHTQHTPHHSLRLTGSNFFPPQFLLPARHIKRKTTIPFNVKKSFFPPAPQHIIQGVFFNWYPPKKYKVWKT